MACEFIEFFSIRAGADFRLVRLRKIPEIPSLNTACGTSVLREGAALDAGKISPVFSQKMLLPVRSVRLLIVRRLSLGFAAGYRRSRNILMARMKQLRKTNPRIRLWPVLPEYARFQCFDAVTRASSRYHPLVTKCD
jgi:hypothetical protein